MRHHHVIGAHGAMRRALLIRTRVIKQRPLVDWRDPFEVGGAIAGLIGIAVLVGILWGAL